MTAGSGSVRMRLITGDTTPRHADGSEYRFGLQDKNDQIHAGTLRDDGKVAFDFTLTVKAGPDPEMPVFTGPFASGPLHERFVYLSWQRINGQGYVNRIKVRLSDLDWQLVRGAQALDLPLEADMTGRAPGGGRVPVTWRIAHD